MKELLITYPEFSDRLFIVCAFEGKWPLDRLKMLRVLGNLLSNAAQAIHKSEGCITLLAALIDGKFRFDLENTGTVIPAEHIPQLFDQFFTSGKAGGTGLGLATCEENCRGT